jgi:hypothetical protein
MIAGQARRQFDRFFSSGFHRILLSKQAKALG